MLLIGLPHAIWQSLLINWLGNLREIVRIDCALSCSRKRNCNPLLVVYAEKTISYSKGSRNVDVDLLVGICKWLRARKVYISNLTLLNPNGALLLQWNDLFAWSAETLQGLTMTCHDQGSSNVISCAAKHAKQLRRLKILSSEFPDPNAISQLMSNNADTLVSVAFDDFAPHPEFKGAQPLFRSLQVLKWGHFRSSNICALISRCPNLTALNVSGGDSNGVDLLSAIAESCPSLQRLQLNDTDDLSDVLLIKLAQGCPQIQYLGFWDCFYEANINFAVILRALPNLHSLVADDLPENFLVDITDSAAPALRILDTWAEFTHAGLWKLTAALPQLSALAVHDVLDEPDCSDLFEHCGNLQHLHFRGCHRSALIASAALQSASMYCHNLQTLLLGHDVPYSHAMLQPVLENCHKLRSVKMASKRTDYKPPYDSRVSFGTDWVRLAQWAPPWDK